MVLLKSSVLKDCAFEGWRFPSVTFFEYHSSNLPSPSLNLASLLPIILFSLTNCTWHPIWIHYFVFFQFSFYTFLIYLLVFFFFSFFNQYINNYDRFYFFAKFYVSISLWCLPNQCPKRVIMSFRKNILMFVWVHSISWLKTALFCLTPGF